MADSTTASPPAFRSLYPAPGPAELAVVYRPEGRRRGRWVRVNMIASVDGGTAVQGRSGGLGGAADHLLFHTLRSFADVIVVGAQTVRTEQYGPPAVPPDVSDAREARGQAAQPTVAVVTRRPSFDWSSRFFVAADVAPLLITVDAATAQIPADARLSGVVTTGADDLDLTAGLDALVERGYHDVLVEGGPTLNGLLVAAGEVDELCVTLAPRLVGGTSSRIVRSDDEAPAASLELASVLTADGFLFLRYRRAGTNG